MRKGKVKWVERYQDIPKSHEATKEDLALVDVETGRIYAIKGKTRIEDLEHEYGHVALGHGNKNPRSPNQYVREELEAELYAYQHVGRPKHIAGYLRRLLYDICEHEYKVSRKRGIKILEKELFSLPVPEEWEEDFFRVKKEVR
jgi:hypothetical protein